MTHSESICTSNSKARQYNDFKAIPQYDSLWHFHEMSPTRGLILRFSDYHLIYYQNLSILKTKAQNYRRQCKQLSSRSIVMRVSMIGTSQGQFHRSSVPVAVHGFWALVLQSASESDIVLLPFRVNVSIIIHDTILLMRALSARSLFHIQCQWRLDTLSLGCQNFKFPIYSTPQIPT